MGDAVVAECAKVVGTEHKLAPDLDRVAENVWQLVKEAAEGIIQAPVIFKYACQRCWKLKNDYGYGRRIGFEWGKELAGESFRIQK